VKLVKKLRVKNDLGIHTRPATYIVKMLQGIKSEVLFSHRRETINAKSILGILMLAAHKNANITISVEGVDAEETMARIEQAFEAKFGE
jgi:phosphocarrier protein HPr